MDTRVVGGHTIGARRVAALPVATGGPYVWTIGTRTRTTSHDPGLPRGTTCALCGFPIGTCEMVFRVEDGDLAHDDCGT